MRAQKQVLRSRAHRALAQEDKPLVALSKKKGRSVLPLPHLVSLFLFKERAKLVILSAAGAKDLLFFGPAQIYG